MDYLKLELLTPDQLSALFDEIQPNPERFIAIRCGRGVASVACKAGPYRSVEVELGFDAIITGAIAISFYKLPKALVPKLIELFGDIWDEVGSNYQFRDKLPAGSTADDLMCRMYRIHIAIYLLFKTL